MITLTDNQLTSVGVALLKAVGVPDESARLVTRYLVDANLVGHDSHGIMRVPYYVRAIRSGRMKTDMDIEIVRETPTSAVVNGNSGIGQVVATKCMELAIKKAEEHTLGCVVVYSLGHIGRLSDYSAMAMNRGMIGITLHGGFGGIVAPFGGVEGRLSTNPICLAMPTSDQIPFIMDFATSVVAEGKVRNKLHRGEDVPDGWIIDKEGRPSHNPKDLYDGGAILPFGGKAGHKATALGVMAMLGGILSGTPDKTMMGDLFLAINIKDFIPVTDFTKRMDAVIKHIKSSKPVSGVKSVLTPGEPEMEVMKTRSTKGIEIPDGAWKNILETAKELNVDIDKLIQ